MKYHLTFILVVTVALLGSTFAPAEAHQPTQDRGDFFASYQATNNQNHQLFKQALESGSFLEGIADDLNSRIKLPTNISMSLADCGAINAFYDRAQNAITICYELVTYFGEIFAQEYEEEDVGFAVLGATTFVIYHELGHALIDVLQLPATGREEDAVDQLAAAILLQDEGYTDPDSVLDAATWFLTSYEAVEDNALEQLAFHGEHSLDAQRFYNLMCWAYGSNQQDYADLVSNGDLPQERAVQCPIEYQRIANAWAELLEPHIK